MAKHTLRITYDDATGAMACEHGCVVEIAGHDVRASDAVELSADSAAALKAIVDTNRAEMEQRATALGIQHAAALSGKEQKGVKKVLVGGSLTAAGGADGVKA
jgi:hypothetical protein